MSCLCDLTPEAKRCIIPCNQVRERISFESAGNPLFRREHFTLRECHEHCESDKSHTGPCLVMTDNITETKNDPINPDHYKRLGKYSPKDVVRAWSLGFNLGNSLKYIARAGHKDPEKLVEDLEKAVWYIQEEIDYLKTLDTDDPNH